MHDGGLTAHEHSEMRDLVLAGTQHIRPAGSHRARFVAVGVSLVMVGAVTGGILTASLRNDAAPAPVVPPSPTAQARPGGWVAYSSGSSEGDIYFVKAGSPPHRVIGSDDDELDQVCPAFSRDGTRLASGQATGSFESGWQHAALVITDLTAEGQASASNTIPLDDLVRPPCPIWSPDGRWVAFGAETENAALWGVDQVWTANVETGEIRPITGLSATDIEWAPDGSRLYIADENGIGVYSIADDQTRLLDDTAGATTLTASPDGQLLVVERRRTSAADRYDLWLMDADGSDPTILVNDYARIHGIGPVWSPDGNRVVFQRSCETFTSTTGQERICREQHDVVVVPVSDTDPLGPLGTQRVVATVQTTEGDQPRQWFPYTVSWSPDSTTLLYLAWEEIDAVPEGRSAGAGLLAVPVDNTVPPTILWETTEGIGSFTAFPKNDFQNWSGE